MRLLSNSMIAAVVILATAGCSNPSGGSWSQNAKLTADDAASGDNFARSVSVSDDLILVGAVGVSDGGVDTWAAYVFEND